MPHQEIAEATHQRQSETEPVKAAVTVPVKAKGAGTPSKNKMPVKAKPVTPVSATAVVKKPVPATKVAVPEPTKAIKTATPAQTAQRVLASLKKMTGKRPKSRASLLRHIATHIPVSQDRAKVAERVCALMQSKGQVQVSAKGKLVTYPDMA